MSRLQTIHGRIVDLRRYTNVHLHWRGHFGPTDRYELWIRDHAGHEHKFTINTRTLRARCDDDHRCRTGTRHGQPVGKQDGELWARRSIAAAAIARFPHAACAAGGIGNLVGRYRLASFSPGRGTMLLDRFDFACSRQKLCFKRFPQLLILPTMKYFLCT